MDSLKFLFKSGMPPLVLAAYPVLALLALNIDQIDPVTALRSLLLSVSASLLLYLLASLVLKNTGKASLAVSLVLILFYSYGHVYNAFETISISGIQPFRHRTLVPLWGIFAGAGLWWIFKAKKIPAAVLQAVAAAALVLLLFPGIQIGNFYLTYYRAAAKNSSTAQTNTIDSASLDLASLGELPDIYLIILDSYARQDVLQKRYGFDNREFIQGLKDLGFYVADCSLSNYGRTVLSLSSQLNMDYLQTLMGENPSADFEAYTPYIKQSAVRRNLEAIGYQTIAFETGYAFTEIRDADVYLTPVGVLSAFSAVNPFEAMLLDTTAVFPWIDLTKNQLITQNINYQNYVRAHYVLDTLTEIPAIPGKKFVFAHILPPHRPYILKADGSIETDPNMDYRNWGVAIDEEYDKIGYRNQISFLNKRMIEIITQIIDQSKNPPVILLFSDHGVSPFRDANLAAYFLPGKNTDDLYPSMTTVNSFRIVFNLYFNGDYELLPDESYRSSGNGKFTFRLYQNEMPYCVP